MTIAVKDGVRTRAEVLELEELDAEALARIDELVHEMRDHIERLARVREARRAKEPR